MDTTGIILSVNRRNCLKRPGLGDDARMSSESGGIRNLIWLKRYFVAHHSRFGAT